MRSISSPDLLSGPNFYGVVVSSRTDSLANLLEVVGSHQKTATQKRKFTVVFPADDPALGDGFCGSQVRQNDSIKQAMNILYQRFQFRNTFFQQFGGLSKLCPLRVVAIRQYRHNTNKQGKD